MQPEDLEKIGMSKPAAKRLLDIIKRKRLKSKFTKLLPVGKFGAGGGYKKAVGAATASSFVPDLALTCLIQVNLLLSLRLSIKDNAAIPFSP